ncbi:MAG TPA: M20/M25/M40 family metallo-hydrolase, partial [Alphaproteobacteria bacterium]|nr:M20/M25/M40 family metallo-hydrolase [Alphaproteobacteria bacterium]
GTEHFQASTVVVSTIDVGNSATNVIPAEARATFNIRFNDLHTFESLKAHLRQVFDSVGGKYELSTHSNGEAFLCEPDRLAEIISDAAERVTGRRPELSTAGGTSDARYIHKACTCAEFGLVGRTMHKADECQSVADIEALAEIYKGVLDAYFPRA